jgi:abhydrolase domain-containing protein 12
LIKDAISVTKWALEEAKVPPERITLVAQSLGIGLASAAAAHFVTQDPKIELGGIILCAPFTRSSDVFVQYRLLGAVPLLMLVNTIPSLQRWFTQRVTDTWDTSTRLQTLVRKSDVLRLTLVHATCDEVIPYTMTETLFQQQCASFADNISTEAVSGDSLKEIDLGEAGTVSEWSSGSKVIRKVILYYGGKSRSTLLIVCLQLRPQ